MKADKGLMEEINITPLTDIFLVLLIIMIVVAPMLQYQGLMTNLGASASSSGSSKDDTFSVYVYPENRFKVNKSDAAIDEVLQKIKEESQNKRDKVYVFIDPDTALEGVAQVLAAAQAGKMQVVIKALAEKEKK